MKTQTKQQLTCEILSIDTKVTYRINGKQRTSKVRIHETTYEEYFITKGIRWYINEFEEVK